MTQRTSQPSAAASGIASSPASPSPNRTFTSSLAVRASLRAETNVSVTPACAGGRAFLVLLVFDTFLYGKILVYQALDFTFPTCHSMIFLAAFNFWATFLSPAFSLGLSEARQLTARQRAEYVMDTGGMAKVLPLQAGRVSRRFSRFGNSRAPSSCQRARLQSMQGYSPYSLSARATAKYLFNQLNKRSVLR